MPKRKVTGEITCAQLNEGSSVWSYTSSNTRFLCRLCSKSIKYDDKVKFSATQHCNSERHKRLFSSQTMKTTISSSFSQVNQFNADLCSALIKLNVPLNIVMQPAFKNFLEKYTCKSVPCESTKNYVEKEYEAIIDNSRKQLEDCSYWVGVDECTDSPGRYLVVIDSLDIEFQRPILFDLLEINSTNHSTISQAVNLAVAKLHGGNICYDSFKLLVTDGASYMLKAVRT